MDAIIELMKDLRIGDPVDDTSFSGPLISDAAAKRFQSLTLDNMAYVISRAPVPMNVPQGAYVAPVVMSGLEEDNDLNYMDSGLPILGIKVVDSIDAAFEELEDTECGLSAGLFTKDPKVIDRFKAEVDVPQVYINESSRSLRPVANLKLADFTK